MFREASAVWNDGPYSGKGTVSTPSRILSNASYVFGLAETTTSTTPAEMLAAAVASSISAIVALKMAELGTRPSSVNTRAVITVDDSGDRWQLTLLPWRSPHKHWAQVPIVSMRQWPRRAVTVRL